MGAEDVAVEVVAVDGATVATGGFGFTGLTFPLWGGPLSTVGFACALAPAIAMAVACGLAGIVPARSASVVRSDSSIDSTLESSESSAGGAEDRRGYNLGGEGVESIKSGKSGGV